MEVTSNILTNLNTIHLLPHHELLIRESAIALEVAAARGYRSITDRRDLEALGFKSYQCRVPALLVPVHGVGGDIVLHQLRPDTPRSKDGKPIKYETPSGTRMALDVPPPVRLKLGDPKVPLWITEGSRKADAAVSAGLCCIAMLGVWNWRGSNAQGGKTALPDWELIALNGRLVYLAFDSDIVFKLGVRAALERLRAFLELRKAIVKVVFFPAGSGDAKVGLDDYLAAGHRVDDLLALVGPPAPAQCPVLTSDDEAPNLFDLARTIAQIEWLWPGWLPIGYLICLAGASKVGKSVLALNLAHVATGGSGKLWPDGAPGPTEPGTVLWLESEGRLSVHTARLGQFEFDGSRIHTPFKGEDALRSFRLDDSRHMTILTETALQLKPRLIVLDSLRASHGRKEADSGLRELLGALQEVCRLSGAAGMVVHHFSKPGRDQLARKMSVHDLRGTTAIVDSCIAIVGMERPNPSDSRVRVALMEGNLTPDRPELSMRWISNSAPQRLEFSAGSPEPAVGQSRTDDAMPVLKRILQEAGAQGLLYQEVLAKMKRAGFTEPAVKRATNPRHPGHLEVIKRRGAEARSPSRWWLPEFIGATFGNDGVS